ncbi:MAG: hypothetical protein R3F48_13595 [Candidatus Zixiibacteriota bacterium]
MFKRVSIDVMGSGNEPRGGIVVSPETTAAELLRKIGLEGYELCPSLSELPFGANEPVYDKVTDSSVLTAYTAATAGGKVL